MNRLPNILCASFIAALFTITVPVASKAGIVCEGANQVLANGEKVVTPYCEAEYLASVARKRGMSVTADEIRNKISVFMSVCALVSSEPEARQLCTGFDPNDHHTHG